MAVKTYTTKELNNIAGTHDPFHCHLEDCAICVRFWSYAKLLREQSKDEDKPAVKTKLKRLVRKRQRTTLFNVKSSSKMSPSAMANKYGAEIRDAVNKGYTVREIAFELNCEDVDVVKVLDYLDIKVKTRSELNIEAYRDELQELVSEGYSVKGIAKLLGKKSHMTISQYLTKYELPRPNVCKMTVDDVEYISGNQVKHRYFDSDGYEVEIKRIAIN